MSKGGRNIHGRITIRGRGGGHKRLYREVDKKREIGRYSISNILKLEYDPNRTGLLALCQTKQKKYFYILTTDQLIPGESLSGKYLSSLSLRNIKTGSIISNIEAIPNKGPIYSRSAGSYSKLVKKEGKKAIIKLPSKTIISLSNLCFASLGQVLPRSPSLNLLKAGRNRWLNHRPKSRGEAMNPIDHPHGGKTSSGQQPKTKWGKLAKWIKTRRRRSPLS